MKLAIVGPGFKPIPDIRGGAIEHLVTNLIYKNEYYNDFEIDVFTVYDEKLINCKFRNTTLIQVKNVGKNSFVSYKYKAINFISRILGKRKQYIYISDALSKKIIGEYDLIIVENNVGIFCSLKKKFPKNRIVFHLHNDFDTVEIDYDKTRRRLLYVCENATSVWAVSKYLKAHLDSLAHNGHVYTLQNCIEKERYNTDSIDKHFRDDFLSKYNIKENEFVILYCGRVDKWKGILELIQAVSTMQNQSNVHVIAVGSQWFSSKGETLYERKIRQFIFNNDVNVTFCGYIDQSKIHTVYSCCNVVAIPSQCAEAFGMTALEAISMGKPCIASDIGGLKDILTDECSILIQLDENYVKNFSKALQTLYDNPLMVKELSERSLERSQLFLGTDEYYHRFKRLVKEVI